MNSDLTYWRKDSALIALYVSADNSFDRMRVNGNVITPGATAFDKFYGPYNVPVSYLLSGNNVIEIDWTNAGAGANPAGFRAKWDATAEPILARTTLASNPATTYFRRNSLGMATPILLINSAWSTSRMMAQCSI